MFKSWIEFGLMMARAAGFTILLLLLAYGIAEGLTALIMQITY
jgi:hypothetical protein